MYVHYILYYVLVKVLCCIYNGSDIELPHMKKTKKRCKDKEIAKNRNEKHVLMVRLVSFMSFSDNRAYPIITMRVDNGDGSKTLGMHGILGLYLRRPSS